MNQSRAPRPSGPRPFAGLWYFLILIASAGFLAAIPFWHAAGRLRRGGVRRLAVAYTLADVFLVVLMVLTPPARPDGSSGNETISTIGGFTVLLVVIAGCVQLRRLRREVYGRVPAPVQHVAPQDPAVARALAARARRQEARRLATEDPALARQLGVGRPDLRLGYDDGGLVDLNTAPPEVVAELCGLDRAQTDALVAGREARGAYFNVGELLVDVAMPEHVADQLRERAVIL